MMTQAEYLEIKKKIEELQVLARALKPGHARKMLNQEVNNLLDAIGWWVEE